MRIKSTLPLLVPGIRWTNHTHGAIPSDDLAVAADLFYRCSDFHDAAPITWYL